MSPLHPLCTSVPALTLSLEFSVYCAFLVPLTGIVFVYPAPTWCATPPRRVVNMCKANGGTFRHRGSKKLRARRSPLSCFRPLAAEKNLTAPQWPLRHQLRFQASTLPFLTVFIPIKKEHHGSASHTLNKVAGRKGSFWNRKNHTLSNESNPYI